MRKKAVGPPRYASYLRCSSDDQAHGDYTTIDTQREINAEHIAGLGGFFTQAYADEGKSGTNLNRPEWKRLLADAQAGKFDKVCVTYMSRLGRGDAFVIAEHELRKAGVGIELVRESFADDLGGYLGKRMTILMDGVYPKQVSIWTRTALQSRAEKGYRVGGVIPYGYLSVYVSDPALSPVDKPPPKRLVPDPASAPFVLAAFELFARTGNLTETVNYLSAVTPRQWSYNSTRKFLANEVYKGVLAHGPWRNEAAHELVVPELLWDLVQERTRTRIRAPKQNPTDDSPFYLRSLVWCRHCGYRMSPANHHGRVTKVRYYECIGNTKLKKNCPVKRVNANSLHASVLEEIRRGAEHSSRMAELIREAVKAVPVPEVLGDRLGATERRLKETAKKIKHCLLAIENGGSTVRPLLARIAELEAEEQSLLQEKYALDEQIAESRLNRPPADYVRLLWSSFLRLWEEADEAERGELIGLVVKRVEMTEKERGICRLTFADQKLRSCYVATSGDVAVKCTNGADDRT